MEELFMPRRVSIYDADWYCDNCNAKLNDQPGFYYDCGVWTCTECGCDNRIAEDEIIENQEDDYDYDEDDDDVATGYCTVCEHGSEYPKCKSRCPYEFYG